MRLTHKGSFLDTHVGNDLGARKLQATMATELNSWGTNTQRSSSIEVGQDECPLIMLGFLGILAVQLIPVSLRWILTRGLHRIL